MAFTKEFLSLSALGAAVPWLHSQARTSDITNRPASNVDLEEFKSLKLWTWPVGYDEDNF